MRYNQIKTKARFQPRAEYAQWSLIADLVSVNPLLFPCSYSVAWYSIGRKRGAFNQGKVRWAVGARFSIIGQTVVALGLSCRKSWLHSSTVGIFIASDVSNTYMRRVMWHCSTISMASQQRILLSIRRNRVDCAIRKMSHTPEESGIIIKQARWVDYVNII